MLSTPIGLRILQRFMKDDLGNGPYVWLSVSLEGIDMLHCLSPRAAGATSQVLSHHYMALYNFRTNNWIWRIRTAVLCHRSLCARSATQSERERGRRGKGEHASEREPHQGHKDSRCDACTRSVGVFSLGDCRPLSWGCCPCAPFSETTHGPWLTILMGRVEARENR